MKAGLGALMKQAQEMQETMKAAQAELATLEFTGASGGGMVTVIMNGKHQVKNVKIDSDTWNEDKDMVEDLIAAAMNDAASKVEQGTKQKMSGLSADFNLPPGISIPF